jgi:hypothetical protein
MATAAQLCGTRTDLPPLIHGMRHPAFSGDLPSPRRVRDFVTLGLECVFSANRAPAVADESDSHEEGWRGRCEDPLVVGGLWVDGSAQFGAHISPP